MVDFESLCEQFGVDLGDKREEFTKELLKNYKTVEENERNKSKLAKAEAELEKYRSDLESLQGMIDSFKGTTEELESLKAENEAFRKREIEAAEQAKKAEFDSFIDKQIREAVGDKQFVNEYVERAFLNDLKEAIKSDDNREKTVGELFREMSDDQDGLFKSEQTYAAHPGISESAAGANGFGQDTKDIFANFVSEYFK